ncbi:MAG: hypothetical protein O3B22_02815 [Proteobacteria bacterium]|nr:hypothetical protein [Pseudomonadota bacterium]
MNLSDILVARRLVSLEDIQRAGEHQRENGGRLADVLVALGMLSAEVAAEAVADIPAAPNTIADTGIDGLALLQLMMKGMYSENLELQSQMGDAMCLPANVMAVLITDATERKLIEGLGAIDTGVGAVQETRCGLTKLGRD